LGFYSEINAVDVSTGANPEIAPSFEFSADLAPADPLDDGPDTPRICAQCNAGGEPLLRVPGTDLWLHPECRPFWARANDGIPDSMRRR
jgi:hypothetical protein